MKKVLVATDLSARSDRALARAAALARQHQVALHVLHVVEEGVPRAAAAAVSAAARKEIEDGLGALGREGDTAAEISVVGGKAYEAITDVAEREGCDLIVLGRHRNESAAAGFGGTTINRVVRVGRRPVLVVVERADEPYRNVLVAVDFSPSCREAVRAALALAPGAMFRFVHAFEVPFQGFLGNATRGEVASKEERILRQMVDEVMEAHAVADGAGTAVKPRHELVLHQGDVLGCLREEAEDFSPDLIAIGTHARMGVARAFLGSVAQSLLDDPPCDVLVARAMEE